MSIICNLITTNLLWLYSYAGKIRLVVTHVRWFSVISKIKISLQLFLNRFKLKDTQRGRSREQHVRHCEADVEGAKHWRLVHLQRSRGEAHRAKPTFGCVFVQRRQKRRMAKFEPLSSCHRFPREPIRHTVVACPILNQNWGRYRGLIN